MNIDPESCLSHLILYHQPTLSICFLHGFVACKLANEIYAIMIPNEKPSERCEARVGLTPHFRSVYPVTT